MIVRIRAQVPEAIQRIEDAFDAVLAAIPDGGMVSASAGGSASAGLGGQANVTV
jgi:hypothetical protein